MELLAERAIDVSSRTVLRSCEFTGGVADRSVR
jgi:hypothetical protein